MLSSALVLQRFGTYGFVKHNNNGVAFICGKDVVCGTVAHDVAVWFGLVKNNVWGKPSGTLDKIGRQVS